MPLPSANKIANEGATAQGRLSASEFNDLINYTAALPVDIQMNGSTILNSSTHIANIPLASSNTTGVITSNFYTYLSAMYEDYSQNGFAAEDHTHTASDVTDLGTAATKNVGVANGVAGLNASGVVPVAQLPSIATTKSDWNATEQQDGYINNKPTVPHISAAQTYISETDGTNTAEVGTVAHPIYAATNAVNATTAAGYTSDGGIATALEDKVDKVAGKGLSTNDFTNAYKAQLDKIVILPVSDYNLDTGSAPTGYTWKSFVETWIVGNLDKAFWMHASYYDTDDLYPVRIQDVGQDSYTIDLIRLDDSVQYTIYIGSGTGSVSKVAYKLPSSAEFASKVNVSDIKDNLTTEDATKPLSAKQGKILNSHLSNVDTSLSEINTALAGKLPLTGGTLTGLLNITTNGKTTTFGSQNASFCHFVTTAPQFYFNKPTIFEGHLRPYVDNDSMLGNKDHRWKNIFAHKITTDQEELPKKILYIGSSHGRDTIGLLPKLAYESGITDIEVQVYYRGSLTLAQIAEYCNDSAYINYGWRKVFKDNAWTAKTYTENTWKMAAMLTENEWDYIFIQRAASEDEVWDSTTSTNLTTILNYIKACCPWTPKVVFSSGYADVWQTGWVDISDMQRSTQRIIDSAMNAKDFGIDVLPIAPYIQTLRNDSILADKGTCNLSISHPYLGRWSSAGTDNQHLDEGIGLFCTACLMYQYLYSRFGKSVYDFDYIPIMSDVESYMGGDWVANGFDSAALSEVNTIALIKQIAVNFDLNGEVTRNSANLYDYTKHGVQKGVINSLGAIVSNGYRTGLIPVKPNRYYYLSNRLNHSASNFTISTLRVILEDGTYTKVLIASTGIADPNYYYLATAAGTYSLVGQFKTPANAAYIEISLTGSASGTELGTDFNITLEDSSATAFAWLESTVLYTKKVNPVAGTDKAYTDDAFTTELTIAEVTSGVSITVGNKVYSRYTDGDTGTAFAWKESTAIYTKKINPVAGTDKAYSDTAFTTELTITTSTSGTTIVVGGTTYTRYTSGDTAVYDASFTPMANKVSKEYIPDTSLEIPVASRIPEPRVEGTVGQVLSINSSGERVWMTLVPTLTIPLQSSQGYTLAQLADFGLTTEVMNNILAGFITRCMIDEDVYQVCGVSGPNIGTFCCTLVWDDCMINGSYEKLRITYTSSNLYAVELEER